MRLQGPIAPLIIFYKEQGKCDEVIMLYFCSAQVTGSNTMNGFFLIC